MGGLANIDNTLRERRLGRNRQRTILWMLASLLVVAVCVFLMVPAISMTAADLDASQQDASTVAVQEDSTGAFEDGAGTEAGASAASPEGDADAGASAVDGSQGTTAGATADTGSVMPDGNEVSSKDDTTGNDADGDQAADSHDDQAMPAQEFQGEFKDKNGDVTLAVHVDAPEGALPEGATMKVRAVKAKDVRDAVDEALAGDEAGKSDAIQAVDISFVDAQGAAVEPALPVVVAFASPKVAEAVDRDVKALVAHIDDKGEARLVEVLDQKALDALGMRLEDGELAIETGEPHVYALVIPKVESLDASEAGDTAQADAPVSDETDSPVQEDASDSDKPAADKAAADSNEAAIATQTITDSEGNRNSEVTKVAMPAQSFSETLASAGDAQKVTVSVKAPKGALPASTTMVVRDASDAATDAAIQKAVEETAITEDRAHAVAVDITFLDANGSQVEPAKPVRVTFATEAIAQQDSLAVVHVEEGPVGQAHAAALVQASSIDADAERVAFSASDFSVYALVYTVDFEYGVGEQVHDFSLPGGGKVQLSELVDILGLLEATPYEDADEFLTHVEDVEFSNPELVRVTHTSKVLGLFGEENWNLESTGPFDTVEHLDITFDDGSVLVIRVTDDQVAVISDLKDIATVRSIDGATKNADGSYTAVAGETYTIKLHFEETSSIQVNMDAPVTYQLPAGFTFSGAKSGKMELAVAAGKYAEVDYTISDSGLITFSWKKDDPNYQALKDSGYLTFDFDITGKFDGSTKELKFSDTTSGTVDVETGGHLDVSKSGTYNAATNQVEYTVTVTGTGVNNNVVVKDDITGDALTFHGITGITSSKGGTVAPTSQSTNANGFNLAFASVANGETITIKYTADVDLAKLAGATDAQKLTFTQNKVQATSDNQTDPKTAENNLQYNIGISDVTKQAIQKGEVGSDGKQAISWEINANRNANISMNGQSITDTINADSRSRLHYTGAGIYVTKRDKSGNVVGTERQLVPWSQLGVSDPSTAYTWTYTPMDTTPYWYQIDYETIADTSGLISNKNLNNSVDGGYGSHGGGQASISPVGGGVGLKKQAVKTDLVNKQVTWEITLQVPKEGLDSCILRDYLPAYISDWSKTPYGFAGKDKLVSVNVTDGLLDGESFSQQKGTLASGIDYVELRFSKTNADGTSSDGLAASSSTRKIRIQVVTKLDDDYLKYAQEHPSDYNAHEHKNKVDLWANSEVLSAEDAVVIDEKTPSISKTHDDVIKSDAGPETVMVKYYVTLTGVNDSTSFPITLTDTFNGKYFQFGDIKTTNWNEDNGYVFGTTTDTPKGGTKGSKRVVEETSPGTLTITLNKEDLPKDGEDYYPLYVVQYYLKVKDEATLLRLKNDAVQQPNGTMTFVNRVTGEDFGTATDDVDYQVPMLSKDLLANTKIQQDPVTGMYKGTFEIDVNPDAKTIGDEATLTLKDTTTNLSIVYDSIRVYEADGTTVCAEAEWNRDGYSVVYRLPNSRHLKVRYDVIVTGTGHVKWVNTAELNGQKVTKDGTEDISAAGNGSGYTYKINILKHDKDDLTKTLEGAEFTLYRWNGDQSSYSGKDIVQYSDLDSNGHLWTKIREDLRTGANGISLVDREGAGEGGYLRRDTWYMLVETKAPQGYELAGYNPVFKIAKDGQVDYDNYVYVNGDTLAIRDAQTPPKKANITAAKVWAGDSEDTSLRKPVTLHLQADGVPYADYRDADGNALASRADSEVTLSDENNWTYTWTNLPGGPTYTVVEDAVPGYVTSYSPTSGLVNDGTITITNTKRQNKTAIHVQKEWDGTPASDVTLQLKRYVNRIAPVLLFDNENNMYQTPQYFAVGAKVTLTYATKQGQKCGYKIYDYGNGTLIKEETPSDTNAKSYSCTFEVPKNGAKVVIDVFISNIVKGNYMFTEVPEVTFAAPPASDEGLEEDPFYTLENHTITLNADNGWQADVDNLLLSDEDGSYTYFVEETGVNDGDQTPQQAGYSVTYENNDGITKGAITVTNSRDDEYSLTLRKTFTGNAVPEDTSGISFTITGPDGFNKTVSFSQFQNGRLVLGREDGIEAGTYTITETRPDVAGVTVTTGYAVNSEPVTAGDSATVELSSAQRSATVAFTNDYYQNKTRDITVSKVWNVDGSDAWPDDVSEVTVELYANGTATGKTAVLTPKAPTATFTDLDEADANRKEIDYAVKEKGAVIDGQAVDVADGKVGGYSVLNGKIDANGKAIITNTASTTTKTTQVSVQKSWNNTDGTDTWPSGLEVEMTLYKVPAGTDGGEAEKVSGVSPITLSATKTQGAWDNIPDLDSTGYEYVVRETAVAGYTAYAVQQNGSTAQGGTAPVVDGIASFVNRENDNGKVAIQVTKNILGNGQPIDLLSDVTNKFTLKSSATGNAQNVANVNKGAFSSEYNTSGYAAVQGDDASFAVTVSGTNAGQALVGNQAPGMYTITEDAKSIPAEVVDKSGKVWKYKETQILTEYAWRSSGDEGQYHYSAVFSKDTDSYTAVPEVAGPYGADLYNGRLDFIVNNIYEPTDETATTETLDLNLNKNWNRGGDTTPPESGSVTFLLHQVATEVTSASGDDAQESAAGEFTLILYDKNESEICRTSGDEGDRPTISFILKNRYESTNVNLGSKYGAYKDRIESSNEDGSGIYNKYSISSADADGNKVIKLYLPDRAASDFSSISFEGNSGSGSGATAGESKLDPDGSGFPKEIVLTAADSWSITESNLLSKVVKGNTTTTYSYYLEETGVTGLASAYTQLDFAGVGSKDHPVTADADGATVTVSATNSVPKPDDKFIKLHKEWLDQDGKPLTNHPDQVLVDVYRVKLPDVMGGGSGSVNFNSIGGITVAFGDPSTWKDNGNKAAEGKIFYYGGSYYYIRDTHQSDNFGYGKSYGRDELKKLFEQMEVGNVDGDYVTKITGTVWTTEQVNEMAAKNQMITRGDLCYYDGAYWVFKHTGGQFGHQEQQYGPDESKPNQYGERGQWVKIATGNILPSVEILLPGNERLLTEEEIEESYIPELRKLINEQLASKGLPTWSDDDSRLERYIDPEDGKEVTIPISEVDKWETSFTAEAGYLYFFFEQPVPGFTTLYGNEEHGVFDVEAQNNGQDVYIQNKTTVGSLSITKNWTGEDISADVVYTKVFRDNVDITDELAASPASYGLTGDAFYPSAGHYFLKVPVNRSVMLQGLPIAPYEEDATAYQYVVQERGYHDPSNSAADHLGDVWNVSDVLEGYTTTYSLRQNTGTSDAPKYEYVKQSEESSSGANSAASPVGAVETAQTTNPETNTQVSNVVFTAGKAEVAISNTSQVKGGVKVTKVFSGIDALPEGFKIVATYELDGETHTVELTTASDGVTGSGSETDPYTWTIDDLPKGTVVTFTETGYQADGYSITTTAGGIDGQTETTATAAATPGEAQFQNAYQQVATLDIYILKVDAETPTKKLPGAKFVLYRYDTPDSQAYTAMWDEQEVDGNGKLTFEGLTAGYYKLVETQTPKGYVKTDSDPWFQVVDESGVLSVSVLDGSQSTISYADGTVTVKNAPGTPLPVTGGTGVDALRGIGLILLLLSAVYFAGGILKRREVRSEH